MGQILVSISDENEEKLRMRMRKKGDLSYHVNEALTKYFKS